MQLLLLRTLSSLCQSLFYGGEGQLALEHVNVFSRQGQEVMISSTTFFLLLLSVQPTSLTWHFIFFLLVDGAGEGISEGDSSEEHFDADDEVLPAGRHGAGADLLSIDEERVGYDATALQDGEDHSYKAATLSSAIYTFV